jgi:hypothetical protein
MDFFKKQGLNLYLVKDKLPAQRIDDNLVGITGWQNLTDFSKYSKQIKKDDNFGFLSGFQYKSKKYIEILDFDIVSKSGINEATQILYNDFEKLDTNNKIGFFSGSTCGNFGVILDTTNNIKLREKIEECKLINKNKCKIEELEILYSNNVVLPPSNSNCKKCNRNHKNREMLNSNIGFCIPNEKQTEFIISLINRFINSRNLRFFEHFPANETNETNKTINTNTDKTINTNTEKGNARKTVGFSINRIHKDKLIKILECLDNNRCTSKLDNGWGQLLVMVANANNDIEVIKKFWERSATGIYSNVKYEDIYKSFRSVKIIENFNFTPLWKMAREDNKELYNKYFHKYDEPKFEFQNITFTEGENATQYINYNQVIEYFEDTKYRFIKSGLGTGKTTFIKKHIENHINKRIIFFTMRQSLAHSINNDFEIMGFTNYLDKHKKYDNYTQKIIISIDSIEKIARNSNFEITPYDIVICDEICSLLNHFSYKEMKNPEISYKMFRNIIKSCKECYFLDGDISNREISWFNKYIKTDNDEIKKPLFNTLSGLKYDLQVSYCYEGQCNKFFDDLEKGKKICIVSMSAKYALGIYEKLSSKYRCKIIYGDSSDKDKKDLRNINDFITELDCFIYSPTISVGVNIDVKHFDNVYGYICGGSVCPRDYFQMLARIRNPKNNTIHILLDSYMTFNGLFDVMTFEEYYNIMYDDEPVNGISYIKLWNKWEQDNANNLWLDIFKWYSIKKGHKFTINNDTKEERETQKQIYNDNIVKFNIKLSGEKAEIIYNALLLKQYQDKIIIENSFKSDDQLIRETIISNPYLNDEDIEILNGIDIRNNWDNMEIVSDRIKKGNATTQDKINFEKSLYYHYFGLDSLTTYDDFKEFYYNKIDSVKLYHQLHNINNLFEILPEIEYGENLDAELTNKKIKYLHNICNIFNITLTEDGNVQLVNSEQLNNTSLIQLLNTDDYNFVIGNIEKSRSTKSINTKNEIIKINKQLTRTQTINKIKDLFSKFGYTFYYTQKQVNNVRKSLYALEINRTITQYLENQNKIKSNKKNNNNVIECEIELDF